MKIVHHIPSQSAETASAETPEVALRVPDSGRQSLRSLMRQYAILKSKGKTGPKVDALGEQIGKIKNALRKREEAGYTPSEELADSAALKAAKAEAKKCGMTLVYDAEYEEYMVNYKGGKEATAYYTDDLDDAVATMRAMAKKGK